ncbi:methylmalonyl-CoA mutase family protein [Sporosarcina aquimarina]|uniref:Methylmalonyl-CoA mutase family protein n=1 Tax=Sporosarcina aquimarina TaxID=114975 RepID=A0ABU4G2W6_9BACL|nr:methylmalonyl-CoA mutase family protein [Sporosarcina aquimarina]MDW0111319.1 methylmalonyl-CoA mutase family protein [Sporosarcina aquimarina]
MNHSDIHNMKQQKFERPEWEEWLQVAESSLKGRTVDSLKTPTAEGISLKPLYTASPNPSHTVRPSHRKWISAQPTIGETGSEWISSMKESLEKGNEAIYLDGGTPNKWDDVSLKALAELMLDYPFAFLHINSEDRLLDVFKLISLDEREKVTGLLLSDTVQLPLGYKNVRTVGIDLESIHMRGADSVTELALALSQAAEHAMTMESFDQFCDKVFFRFPADTHFFMEISKFRAFRTLWQLFCSAYDMNDNTAVPLMAVTSLRSYSKIDPYVNLLRAGNSSFSAVLGGADWLTVYPYNELTGNTQQSLRYARNVQLIIREETHADKVADPGGGSYFIEQLTKELVHKAWHLFLEIEEMGGSKAFLHSGKLDQLAEERKENVASGVSSLIGTSVYADPANHELVENSSRNETARPAYPFEELRKKTLKQPIDIRLVVFGSLKSYKPRADFAAGFLATAGLTAKHSPSFTDAYEAIEWLEAEKPDYAILCAAPGQIEQVAPEISSKKPPGVVLDVAGRVSDELTNDWLANGLDGFVFKGQNRIEKLSQVLSQCKGGEKIEEA